MVGENNQGEHELLTHLSKAHFTWRNVQSRHKSPGLPLENVRNNKHPDVTESNAICKAWIATSPLKRSPSLVQYGRLNPALQRRFPAVRVRAKGLNNNDLQKQALSGTDKALCLDRTDSGFSKYAWVAVHSLAHIPASSGIGKCRRVVLRLSNSFDLYPNRHLPPGGLSWARDGCRGPHGQSF